MLKKILFGCILSLLISTSFAMTDGPNFILLPNIKTQYLMSIDSTKALKTENQIVEVVKQTLNITPASPYRAVRIRTIYNDQNQVASLIVYLLSAQYKSFDVV